MSNLEIMDSGVMYTTNAYVEAYKNKMNPSELSQKAAAYSANSLYQVITSPDGMCKDYTRQNNLRYDMATLSKDAIINELLKNIVNVATYQVVYDTRAGNELGTKIRPGMTSEQIAVVVFNAMSREGVEKGYEMICDPNVLFGACQNFAFHRGSVSRKDTMDNIGKTNPAAIQMNNELDIYYARYGDRPRDMETTVLNEYDAPDYGRK